MPWVDKSAGTKKSAEVIVQGGTKTLPEISWMDFAKTLRLNYDPDRLDIQLSEYAFEQAHGWIQEYEKDSEVELGEELKDQIRFKIEEGMQDHWSLQKVLSRNLDIEGLVDLVNQWSKRGQQMAIYEGRDLPAGEGITSFSSGDDGIVFTIAEPFMIAFIEAAYCVISTGDEGLTIEDMDGGNVAATMRRITECEGSKIKFDLDRWGEQQSSPSYQDLAKIVEANPGEVKNKEGVTE